jgi:hypothetical protein
LDELEAGALPPCVADDALVAVRVAPPWFDAPIEVAPFPPFDTVFCAAPPELELD